MLLNLNMCLPPYASLFPEPGPRGSGLLRAGVSEPASPTHLIPTRPRSGGLAVGGKADGLPAAISRSRVERGRFASASSAPMLPESLTSGLSALESQLQALLEIRRRQNNDGIAALVASASDGAGSAGGAGKGGQRPNLGGGTWGGNETPSSPLCTTTTTATTTHAATPIRPGSAATRRGALFEASQAAAAASVRVPVSSRPVSGSCRGSPTAPCSPSRLRSPGSPSWLRTTSPRHTHAQTHTGGSASDGGMASSPSSAAWQARWGVSEGGRDGLGWVRNLVRFTESHPIRATDNPVGGQGTSDGLEGLR